MRQKNGLLTSTLLFGALVPGQALGAQVTGRVVPPPAELVGSGALGHSRTKVALPSAETRNRRGDLAVFLKVRDSLPLPESTTRWSVEVAGAELRPSVVACAVDEVIEFKNGERRAISVSVGGAALGRVEPGASVEYPCRDGGQVSIRVAELPHLEGLLYVGESVGVAGRPDASGRFVLSVPKGTYELRVFGPRSILATREVSVEKADLDLGLLETGAAAVEAAPPPPPPPAEEPSAAASKVKTTPPPPPKPAKLKLEKPEGSSAPAGEATAPKAAKPAEPKAAKPAEPKAAKPAEPKPDPGEAKPAEPKPAEPRPVEPKGGDEPAPAKLPTPTKPKVEKKGDDDFFELEP